jgi:hypothetical protein
MIKSFSAVAIATLVLVGCGGTGSTTNETKAATIKGLKNFGNNGVAQEENTFKKVSASYNANQDKWDSGEGESASICESGTMTLPQQPANENFSFSANNCKNGETTIDGAANIQVNEAKQSGVVEVTKDFSLIEGSDTFSVSKGSKVVASEGELTANVQAKVNGEELFVKNLSVSYDFSDDVDTMIAFNSGEINIGGYNFKFVEQTVPFSGGDQLTSGLLKLIDGAGHRVEIAVVEADVVELRIDENGDGVFQESEKDRSFN